MKLIESMLGNLFTLLAYTGLVIASYHLVLSSFTYTQNRREVAPNSSSPENSRYLNHSLKLSSAFFE